MVWTEVLASATGAVGTEEVVPWPIALLTIGAAFALALSWAVGPALVQWFRDGQQIEPEPDSPPSQRD